MPRGSYLQPGFSSGEWSPSVYGRTDSERHRTAVAHLENYLPLTKGPAVRRGGTKYVANYKDPSKPPAFLEFEFSQTQNYVLEFGDKYVRFFVPSGQITTTSTHFKVSGTHGHGYVQYNSSHFFASRSSPIEQNGKTEFIATSSVLQASSILEIGSPYSWPDVHDLKFSQKDDTLYIVHSSYPEYKLIRFGHTLWDLKQVLHMDGPYLPFNTYKSPGDSTRISIVLGTQSVSWPGSSFQYNTAFTSPKVAVSSAVSGAGNRIRLNVVNNPFVAGDKVFVQGVVGTTEANSASSYWTVYRSNGDDIDLEGTTFANAYIGSGAVYPALFEPPRWSDQNRTIALTRADGGRAWGRITNVRDPAHIDVHIDGEFSPLAVGATGSNVFQYWQLGVWSLSNGYPNAVTFHQQRMILGGAPAYPQRLDGSNTGDYENFQDSGSSYIISDNNSFSFNLDSEKKNIIRWLKSDAHGLLAGTMGSEFNITPNNQAAALTPTNVDAKETSVYGSFNADAVKTGNTVLYIQQAQRRVHELNYFFQVDTYRSTDVAELADHLTTGLLTKLAVQKEPNALVWATRADGGLLAMGYSRDDSSIKAGWSRQSLGGKSDSAGSAPLVKSIAVIPSADGTYDQVWMAVHRFINGTSVGTIEYVTRLYDDSVKQEDAFQVDCGGTYDSPISITNITTAGSAIVTAASHGFSNGDTVKINSVVGLNSSITDVNGYVYTSNLVNAHTFIVGSQSTNAFFLKDFDGNYIDSRPYSVYVSGGEARKLVSSISGLTWLKNETVAVLADGGVHPDAVVNSAGVLALEYPAAKVQIGYRFKSRGKTLRADVGSADGTSIGKMRRAAIAAFQLHNVGDFRVGPSFNKLTPIDFSQADQNQADVAPPLFSGIKREPLEGEHNFDGTICWEQSDPLPGMVQSLTLVFEENDV